MNIGMYLFPFLLSFLLATVFLAMLVRRSRGGDEVERMEDGRRHKSVSRFGGIALILAFIAAVLLDAHLAETHQLLGLLLGAFLILIVVWYVTRKASAKASLASLAIVVGLPIAVVIEGRPGWEVGATVALAALVMARHTSNIKRLLSGGELSASRG